MPAESCAEIKAREQERAVSGKYWLNPQKTKIDSNKFLVIILFYLIIILYLLTLFINFFLFCHSFNCVQFNYSLNDRK